MVLTHSWYSLADYIAFSSSFLSILERLNLCAGFHYSALKVALSIAGSDSGAGAGIQADIKTFSALGVYGCTAITAITAQNTRKVSSILEVSPEIIEGQIRSVPTTSYREIALSPPEFPFWQRRICFFQYNV